MTKVSTRVSTKKLVEEIESFNNAVYVSRKIKEGVRTFKFEATKFAAHGISILFAKKYGVRVWNWKGSNEYFFAIA